MHRYSILFALAAIACDGTPETPDAATDAAPLPRDAGPPIPDVSALPSFAAANAVTSTDARFEGQQRFLWDTWGLEVLGSWPPAEFMVELMTAEPEVFGDQFASFGFIRDPDDDLPLGLKRGVADETLVYETCALCHTGRLPDGRVWFGHPNRDLELSRFQIEVSARWEAAGNAPLFDAASRDRMMRHGPGRIGSETSASMDVIPVEYPPVYELAERAFLNYGGSGRDMRSEAYLSLFAFGAGFPNAREAVVPWPHELRLEAFLAFFGALPAPDAPAGEPDAISRGEAAFAAAGCGDCHHVGDLGADGITTLITDGAESLPGAEHEFGTIRTDPGRTRLQDGDEGYVVFFNFIREHRLRVGPTDGYRPAELRGLWASAPYLHNGTVPTLEALLSPGTRPATFDRLGFEVDSSLPGNGNDGHEFGATLTDAEKNDLVAYLESL